MRTKPNNRPRAFLFTSTTSPLCAVHVRPWQEELLHNSGVDCFVVVRLEGRVGVQVCDFLVRGLRRLSMFMVANASGLWCFGRLPLLIAKGVNLGVSTSP